MTDGGKQDFETPVKIKLDVRGKSKVILYNGDRSLSIGRFDEADIPLIAERVSRHHADIIASEGQFFVVDAGSRNGTWVNGRRVRRSVLHPGDVIKIGSARLTFGEAAAQEAGKAATATPAAPARTRKTSARVRKVPVTSRRRRLRMVVAVSVFVVLCLAVLTFIFMELEEGHLGAGAPARVAIPGAHSGGAYPPDTDAARRPGWPESPQGTGDPRRGPDTDVAFDANAALDAVGQEAASGLGWEALDRLREIVATYPLTPAADEATRQITLLEGVRATVTTHGSGPALALLGRLRKQERYGEAVGAARLFALVAEDDDARREWQRRGEAMETAAKNRFHAEEEVVTQFLVDGKPEEALRTMTRLRGKFGCLEFFESLFARYAEAGLAWRACPPVARLETGAEFALEDRVAVAFEECRFGDLLPLYYSMLVLNLSPEGKLQAVEGLVEAIYLQRMLEDFFEHLQVQPIEVSLSSNFRGRVVSATSEEVHYEFDLEKDEAKFRHKKSWDRIPAATKFEIFENAPLSREGLLGLFHFSREMGYEEGAQKVLIRLWRIKGSRPLVAAVLSRYLGIPMPEGGFVLFEGRLVTSEEKATTVARRKKAAAAAKMARAEWVGGKMLDLAKRLRHEGSFGTATAVLERILRGDEETGVKAEAKRMLESELLAVQVLQETGPSANRLDVYVLGEGYPAKDDAQAAFLDSARLAIKLLFNEEPYREYRSYFNVSAVQLASREAGVDRLPGEVKRDTALNGKVEWDRFTVESGKVKAMLEKLGGGASDGQAIVIGNDYAGVSTGGGGVSAACKTSLGALPHEMGHALAALHDEYDFTAGTDPKRSVAKERENDVPTSTMPPNLMAGSDKEDVLARALWKPWIDAGTEKWWNGTQVGAFEGGAYTPFNVWRPQAGCKMRSSGMNFCVVCMEQMVIKIYESVRPIDRVEPSEPEIVVSNGEAREIRLWPMKPETRFLDVKWELFPLADEVATGPTGVAEEEKGELLRTVYRRYDAEKQVVEIALLRARDLKRKRYRLRVEVTDSTPWVLAAERDRLKDSREWIVLTK